MIDFAHDRCLSSNTFAKSSFKVKITISLQLPSIKKSAESKLLHYFFVACICQTPLTELTKETNSITQCDCKALCFA